MTLYPIFLLIIIVAHDAGLRAFTWSERGATIAGVTFSPVETVAIFASWIVTAWAAQVIVARRSRRRLTQSGDVRALNSAERALRVSRVMTLAGYAAVVLCLGWIQVVRQSIGDLVLLDEIAVMLPVIIALAGGWWVHYPIDQLIRSAMLMRRLDMGQPVYRMPSRSEYVLQQLRMQILMLLVPILLILGASEGIATIATRVGDGQWPNWMIEGVTLVVAACVFIAAPGIVRLVLEVEVLRRGQVYDDVEQICAANGVRVRGVLLWHTHGAVINAAVMGVLGRMRYILLTDALIDVMNRRQLQAVIAHEVAHVRLHHMLWLVMALIGAMLLTTVVADAGLLIISTIDREAASYGLVTDAVVTFGMLAVALVVFGWVSRRFERQADTFAVTHLSRHLPPAEDDDRNDVDDGNDGDDDARSDAPDAAQLDAVATDHKRVRPDAVYAMTAALMSIAELNGIDPERSSWRHGSIAWRTRYLRGLVDASMTSLMIHTIARRIKLATAVALFVSLGYIAVREYTAPPVAAASAAPPPLCAIESPT